MRVSWFVRSAGPAPRSLARLLLATGLTAALAACSSGGGPGVGAPDAPDDAPAPGAAYVTSVSPTSGAPGTTLEVTGALPGDTHVALCDVPLDAATFVTDDGASVAVDAADPGVLYPRLRGDVPAAVEAGGCRLTLVADGTALQLDGAPTFTVEAPAVGAASAATSTVTASPTSLLADGASEAVIVVTLRDANGVRLTSGGATVTLAPPTVGAIGDVTDRGDGTYAATYVAGATPGEVPLVARLDGEPFATPGRVVLTQGAATPTTSTVVADPAALPADGTSTATVTVTLRDGAGDPLDASVGANAVTFDAPTHGTLGPVRDLGDGTYEATYTAGTTASPVDVRPRLFDVAFDAAARIDLRPGAASAQASTVRVTPALLPADGTSTATVTVTLRDANGNPVGASGGTVTLDAPALGSLGDVTDVGDGTYVATFTAGVQQGPVTLRAALDGAPLDEAAALELVGAFYRAENGVTVRCPSAAVGESGEVDGVTYVKRDRAGLDALVDAEDTAGLETACTTGVTDLSALFAQATWFDGDVGHWDTGDVTTLQSTFFNANAFAGDLGAWDTGRVTDMSYAFRSAASFDADLNAWDTSRVTTMRDMFHGATAFDGRIGDWDVGQVEDMTAMFRDAKAFDQPLNAWDVGSVREMAAMFWGAEAFDRDLAGWDTSRVERMGGMFLGANAFDGDVTTWDVGAVTTMKEMFSNARSFDRDISGWDVAQVTDMDRMFEAAKAFDQDLSRWCVSGIASAPTDFAVAANAAFDASKHPDWGRCPQVTRLDVTPSTVRPPLNGSETLAYVFEQTDAPGLTWTSSDEGVATVDASGVVSGVAPGTATVTVRSDVFPDVQDAVTVTVPDFRRAANGVTIVCDGAQVGDRAVLNGTTYVKRTKAQITPGNAATTCTSGITDMAYLFGAQYSWDALTNFNANIEHWDVSDVRTMRAMFRYAENFRRSLQHWDVSSVRNMREMFFEAKRFNGNVAGWDVSSVTNMRSMFHYAWAFNRPIGGWDVSNVTNMRGLFRYTQFDQPIGDWDTGNVTDMDVMFNQALFDQDISGWCVSKIAEKPWGFDTLGSLRDAYQPNWGTCPGG